MYSFIWIALTKVGLIEGGISQQNVLTYNQIQLIIVNLINVKI